MRLTSSGSLDFGFGTFGVSVGSADDEYNTLLIDENNNIFVSGSRIPGGTSFTAFLLIEYDTSGSIGTFNHSIDFNAGNNEEAHKILQDSDGNIYLVGSYYSSPNEVAVAKVLLNGTLDTSFSTDGGAIFDMTAENSDALVNDAVLDSNNNIIVVGQAVVGSFNTPMLGRIKPDGSLDNMFNSSGFFSANSCNDEAQLTSLLLLDDENWVVAGHCYIDGTFKNNLELTQYQLLEP